jgi:hypothetical protein
MMVLSYNPRAPKVPHPLKIPSLSEFIDPPNVNNYGYSVSKKPPVNLLNLSGYDIMFMCTVHCVQYFRFVFVFWIFEEVLTPFTFSFSYDEILYTS